MTAAVASTPTAQDEAEIRALESASARLSEIAQRIDSGRLLRLPDALRDVRGIATRIAMQCAAAEDWSPPQPLPKLMPVPEFVPELLPSGLQPWTMDVAERVGCPVEYVAAAALVAAGCVIGRSCGIRPKRYDSWVVIPNLWGALVGVPGEKKSPALKEALMPMRKLEKRVREEFEAARRGFEADQEIHRARREAVVRKAKTKPGESAAFAAELRNLDSEAPAEPVEKRFLLNDATVESIAKVLQRNPRGALQQRDELVGWFAGFDKPGHENDRQFFLEAWDGDGEHSFDRITRQSGYVRGLCLGVIGTIQPGPLAAYLRGAARGGMAHDGLLQRFQLMVYPDAAPNRLGCDRPPNDAARERYCATFEALAQIPDPVDDVQTVRFDRRAQAFMDEWAQQVESLINDSQQEHELVSAHFAKYRSLGPALALICQLCEEQSETVTLAAAQRSAALCHWLQAHARRVYTAALAGPVAGAENLLEHLREYLRDERRSPFTVRQLYRNGWAGLTEPEVVQSALAVLERYGWVRSTEIESTEKGGRPTREYRAHPNLTRSA